MSEQRQPLVRFYIRCSHVESAKSNLSPETQVTLCRQRYEHECQQWRTLKKPGDPPPMAQDGWSGTKRVGQETTDGLYIDRAVSAASTPLELRPAGGLLLQNMRAGDVLIVAYPDRIFRSTADWSMRAASWHRQNIRLIFVSPDIDYMSIFGKLVLDILMAVAAFDSALKSEKNKDVIRELNRQGRVATGAIPMGYRRHPKNPKKLIADNEVRRDIYLIAQLHAGGFTFMAISDMLEKRDAEREGREMRGQHRFERKPPRKWTKNRVQKAHSDWEKGKIPPPDDEPMPEWYRQKLAGERPPQDDAA